MSDQAIQLMHGDCLSLMPLIPAGSADMILTDLPYGTTACKWDTVIPFEPLWEAYERIIKPKGAIVLFGSQPFTSALVASNFPLFRHAWVWDKTVSGCFTQADVMPMKTHEDVCVFSASAGNPRYYPQKSLRDNPATFNGAKNSQVAGQSIKHNAEKLPVGKVYTHSFPKTILSFSMRADPSRGLHPTQKSVALLEYLIRTYTNEGDTVLDSCMGSASTAIACMRTGRKFIGIERDDTYFEVSCQRVKDEQRQERLFTV